MPLVKRSRSDNPEANYRQEKIDGQSSRPHNVLHLFECTSQKRYCVRSCPPTKNSLLKHEPEGHFAKQQRMDIFSLKQKTD